MAGVVGSLSPSSPLPFRPLLLSYFAIVLYQTDVVTGICTLFCAGSVLAPGASPVFRVVHSEVPHVPPALPCSRALSSSFFLSLNFSFQEWREKQSYGGWLPLAVLLSIPASLWWETKLLQGHPKAQCLC